MKQFLIILSIVCVGLGVGLILRHTKAQEQLTLARAEAISTSNTLFEVRAKLAEQETLSTFLQANLSEKSSELAVASNNLALTAASLASMQSEAKAAQTELLAKTTRITELEAQNDEMTKKLNELAGSINTLETQITETKRKLSAAEGDRTYLTKELSRLQSDKAELVRQFNDLAVLKAQVALLKEEAVINQRLAWMANGVYQQAGRKGAEALIGSKQGAFKSDTGLNVELDQQGGSRVLPSEKK